MCETVRLFGSPFFIPVFFFFTVTFLVYRTDVLINLFYGRIKMLLINAPNLTHDLRRLFSS